MSLDADDAKLDALDTFVGFDLGHGDTCLVFASAQGDAEPVYLPVQGHRSFPTVLARKDGIWLIGEEAETADTPDVREIMFKCRPSRANAWASSWPKLEHFASTCFKSVARFLPADSTRTSVIVGCPSGWDDKTDIDVYRRVFIDAGLPNPFVVKESRAAFIQAKDALLIPPEKLNGSIIVIDIGSSTTDITHIVRRNVVDVEDGDQLGASLIDGLLFAENVKMSQDAAAWHKYFNDHPADRNEAIMSCRRLKEKYFDSKPERRIRGVKEVVPFPCDDDFTIIVNQELIEKVINAPLPALNDLSWTVAYRKTLEKVKARLKEPPDYFILTGGASRMAFTASICQSVFSIKHSDVLRPDAAPETTVASGLARYGRWLKRCRQFETDVAKLYARDYLLGLIRDHVPKVGRIFMRSAFDQLADKIFRGCIDDWRKGKINARDGLLHAVMARSKAWEESKEAWGPKVDATSELTEILKKEVGAEVDKISKQYHIPGRPLQFSFDLLAVNFSEAFAEMLAVGFFEWLSKKTGEAVDEILPRAIPDWVVAGFILACRAYFFVGSLADGFIIFNIMDEPTSKLTDKIVGTVQEQMRVQFKEQVDDVLTFIS